MRVRKKPVEVEAVHVSVLDEVIDNYKAQPQWIRNALTDGTIYWAQVTGDENKKIWYIKTLEGKHCVSPGDYIIRGVAGELYPCKPDIFTATYEIMKKEKIVESGTRRSARYRIKSLQDIQNLAVHAGKFIDEASEQLSQLFKRHPWERCTITGIDSIIKQVRSSCEKIDKLIDSEIRKTEEKLEGEK